MKLLLFTSRFHPDKGGVENVVETIFKSDSSYELVTAHTESSFKGQIDDSYDNRSITRIWMGAPSSLKGWLILPYRFCVSVRALVKTIKTKKIDLINYHFADDNIFLFSASRMFIKVPYILNIHGEDLQSFSTRTFHKIFWPSLIKDAESIVVNSKYMQEELIAKFKTVDTSKIKIIPNSIDLRAIDVIPARKIIETPYIFAVGRFVFKKGFDILVQAFEIANLENVNLVIEGSGEEMESVELLVNELDLGERVLLTKSSLSAEDKFAVMKGSLFGVIPSRKEPFGIVALEFMGAGVALVASATGGLLSILEDEKTGLLFENGNEVVLAEKLKKLSSDIGLRSRIAAEGKKEAEKYSVESVIAQYKKLYEDTIR